MPAWLFIVYLDAAMKEGKRVEISWPLVYTDSFVRCGESGEDLRVMVGWFVEVCRRRGLKFNADRARYWY